MLNFILEKYLDKNEALSLRKELETAQIQAIIKQPGLPRYLGGIVTYQVQIEKSDSAKAREIANLWNEKQSRNKAEKIQKLLTQCPFCESAKVARRSNLNLFDKIRFIGVQALKCEDCRGEWFV